MANPKTPKAVLFDIGGVIALSPFQGILDFERKHNIPSDWINFAIRYGSPNGHWQRLERGEIELDSEFFKGFAADLQNKDAWREFHSSSRKQKKSLKDRANPTQLGDHVSLKAEAQDSKPTDQDHGAQSSSSSSPTQATQPQSAQPPSLSKLAKDTAIGDPVSLESEEVVQPPPTEPPPHQNNSPPPSTSPPDTLPPMPSIDAESLLNAITTASNAPDPYLYPALLKLRQTHPRPLLGALSNTINFPPSHPVSKPPPLSSTSPTSPPFNFNHTTLPPLFDIFIASADVGLRKPSPEIYQLAIRKLDEFDRQKRGGNGVQGGDVVFLDDIGENLRAGREAGMRTIGVRLGRTWRAVKELDGVLGGGWDLLDEGVRRVKL